MREKGCRWPEGAVHQDVYGCLTCGVEAGLCSYCALECHKDHEIFEVGPRNNFQCDCPTSLFTTECKGGGGQDKKPVNQGNVYNQNFKALFCSCHKQILTEEEDMMQCPLCADYFHPKCQSIPLDIVTL